MERANSKPALLGIPLDSNSSYLRGPAEAPPLIREAFHCDSSNSWSETGVNLGEPNAYVDAGDLKLPEDARGFAIIEKGVDDLLKKGLSPLCLGGDHSVTYPILRTFGRHYPSLTIVHFDAHPDLYHEFQGSRVSHACPFARIMEERLAKRLIQIGIRTMVGHQREQAERFGVELFEMRQLPAMQRLELVGPVYVSFDIDVLDPAFRAWGLASRARRNVSPGSYHPPTSHHRDNSWR